MLNFLQEASVVAYVKGLQETGVVAFVNISSTAYLYPLYTLPGLH